MSASPVKTALVEMSPSKKQASIEKAQELLTSGKRNLLVSDYPSAVSDLAEASSLWAKIHGKTSAECGEVHLYYGKALLEHSRHETGFLGQWQWHEVEEQVFVALWMAIEVLELAKNAFTKTVAVSSGDKKKDAELKLAEAHLKLGEAGLEHDPSYPRASYPRDMKKYYSEADMKKYYSGAVENLVTSLKIMDSVLPEDSRSIFEVMYQLGRAFSLARKFKAAKASLGNALKVLRKRIENLKKIGDSENIAKEIKDMETLIDEIKEIKKWSIRDIWSWEKDGRVVWSFSMRSKHDESANPYQLSAVLQFVTDEDRRLLGFA